MKKSNTVLGTKPTKPPGSFKLLLLLPWLAAIVLPTRSVYAAGTINVTPSSADEFGTGAACSLREAIKTANDGANFGGCVLSGSAPFTINVPAGTYNLTRIGAGENLDATGDLDVRLSGTTISGTGAATTIIQWDPAVSEANRERVIEANPDLLGNFNFTLSGVTIKGGRDNSFGGGGMISGSLAGTNGVVNVSSCIFTDNKALSPSASPVGGAIGHAGGTLNVTGSTFDGNSSYGSGGAIYADPYGAGSVTISNSTFTNNTSTNGNGGALRTGITTAGGPMNVDTSTFTGNSAQGVNGTGGAIFNESGALLITKSSFLNNLVTNASGGRGGAIGSSDVTSPNITVSFSRFVGNNAATPANGKTLYGGSNSTLTATNNWWGSNAGPGANDVAGTVTSTPWIILSNTPGSNPIQVNHSTTLTADFLHSSAAPPPAAPSYTSGQVSALVGLPVTWGSVVSGTLSGQQTTLQSNGTATATFTANAAGAGSAGATVDNATAIANITIDNTPPPTVFLPLVITHNPSAAFNSPVTEYIPPHSYFLNVRRPL